MTTTTDAPTISPDAAAARLRLRGFTVHPHGIKWLVLQQDNPRRLTLSEDDLSLAARIAQAADDRLTIDQLVTELEHVPTPAMPEVPAPAALSQKMQAIARDYLDARKRAGAALLDQARFLAEARAAAKHGEWGIFLEATQTNEDWAGRLLNIHDTAELDPRFADAIRSNFLNLSTAHELASSPADLRDRLLSGAEPPTVKTIRDEKRDAKLRDVAEFEQAVEEIALPPEYAIVVRRLANVGVTLTSEVRDGRRWYTTHRTGKPTGITTPTWSNVTDRAEHMEAQADTSLIVGQRTDPHQPDPKEPPPAALTLAQLDDTLPKDLEKDGYYWHSAAPPTIAHNDGWRGDAPTVDGALDLARLHMDAKTEPITVFPGLNVMECKALMREAKSFIAVGADRKWPTIGQATRIAARMALEVTEP